jgi:hypothetical protein
MMKSPFTPLPITRELALIYVASLVGLLLWSGTLSYVYYTYALSVVDAPFNGLFLVYIFLVVLSAYTIIGIVASIDTEAVYQRFAAAPAKALGMGLFGVGVLAAAGLTYPVITTLVGSEQFDARLHADASPHLAVIGVHLVIAVMSFALFGIFVRSVAPSSRGVIPARDLGGPARRTTLKKEAV